MISDQLELALDDVRVKIPWAGRSPRDLTRARSPIFLSQEAQKSVSDLIYVDQLELLPEAVKEGPPFRGAPLLIPLED